MLKSVRGFSDENIGVLTPAHSAPHTSLRCQLRPKGHFMSRHREFNCPHCQETLRVGPSMAGRSAKCPRCNQRLTLPAFAAETALVPVPPVAPPPPPPAAPVPVTTSDTLVLTETSSPTTTSAPRGGLSFTLGFVLLTAFGSFLSGYIAGREHIKYEIRKTLGDVFSAIPKAPQTPTRRPPASPGR